MAKMQIRIDRSNQSALAKAARANRRSIVAEANRIIAEYFAALAAKTP
jgi:hypothetical protein